jgi:hypothetical protein
MSEIAVRSGLRLRFEQGINSEVRRALLEFSRWLRSQVDFPIRVVAYIKCARRLKSMDGEICSATFFQPYDKDVEPYIRVSTGDYLELLDRRGKDNALAAILHSLAHEVAHYEQWVNDRPTSCKGAANKATRLVKKYALTREHP